MIGSFECKSQTLLSVHCLEGVVFLECLGSLGTTNNRDLFLRDPPASHLSSSLGVRDLLVFHSVCPHVDVERVQLVSDARHHVGGVVSPTRVEGLVCICEQDRHDDGENALMSDFAD